MGAFKTLRSSIQDLLRGPDNIRNVARLLHHWALWKAHMQMRAYIKEAEHHPGLSTEIRRAPILLELFLKHLKENAHLHIDVDQGLFFNEDVIGDPESWRLWQENGYSLARNSSNYPIRVQRWANLFNASKQTYEKVIAARNEGYTDAEIVPYWKLWEVGVLDDDPGYPSYTGLNYVDRADQDLPGFIQQARRYLDEYAVSRLNGRDFKPAPFRTTQWLSVARKSGIL